MSRNIAQSHPERIEKPLAVALGGTGQRTANLALNALGGIPNSAIGTVNGPIPLNANAKIPVLHLPTLHASNINELSVILPNELYIGLVSNIIITDLDSNKPLTITTSVGEITNPRSRLPDEESNRPDNDTSYFVGIDIPYQSNLIGQTCIITINGYNYQLPILGPTYVFKNIDITYNSNGDTIFFIQVNVRGIIPTFENSALPSGYNPYFRVQISTTTDFTNSPFIFEANINLVNNRFIINETLYDLIREQHYYMRFKLEYHDPNTPNINNTPYNSEWQLHEFTVPPEIINYYLNNYITDQYEAYSNSDFALGDYSVNMDYTGDTIAINTTQFQFEYIGIELVNLNQSLASNINWVGTNLSQESPISPFGLAVAISGNGKYIYGFTQDVNDPSLNITRYKHTGPYIEYNATPIYVSANNIGTYGAIINACTNFDGTVVCFKQATPSHLWGGEDALNIMHITNNSNDTLNNVRHQELHHSSVETVDSINSDEFGRAIALDSLGTTLVIGSPSTSTVDGLVGAAYVLTKSGNNDFTLQQKIIPTNRLATGLRFGHAVTISHDGNTIAISSVLDLVSGDISSGVVDIYKKVNDIWTLDGHIAYPIDNVGANPNNGFGYSIKLNNNGKILVVGVPWTEEFFNGELLNSALCGGVYVYQRINGVWTLIQQLYDSQRIDGAELGRCIAMTTDARIILASCAKPYVSGNDMYNSATTRNVLVFNS